MRLNLRIGAPSLDGKGDRRAIDAALEGVEFPCTLRVTNHMPRAAIFPESGVELASAYASPGNTADMSFASAPILKRLLRTASQVAELNGFELALTVEAVPSADDPLERAARALEAVAAPADAGNTAAEGDASTVDTADAPAPAPVAPVHDLRRGKKKLKTK